jgi:hypothetical protein
VIGAVALQEHREATALADPHIFATLMEKHRSKVRSDLLDRNFSALVPFLGTKEPSANSPAAAAPAEAWLRIREGNFSPNDLRTIGMIDYVAEALDRIRTGGAPLSSKESELITKRIKEFGLGEESPLDDLGKWELGIGFIFASNRSRMLSMLSSLWCRGLMTSSG